MTSGDVDHVSEVFLKVLSMAVLLGASLRTLFFRRLTHGSVGLLWSIVTWSGGLASAGAV